MNTGDRIYLEIALALAESADAVGELGVAAVLVVNGHTILATDHNRNISTHSRIQHAEVRVLQTLQTGTQYNHVTLYSTLEPCPMCYWTAVVARVNRLVWACNDPHGGGAAHQHTLSTWQAPEITGTPFPDLAERSKQLITGFFTRMGRKDILTAWDALP